MFFEEDVWKTSMWGETFIRQLYYPVVLTEIKMKLGGV